MVRVTSAFPAEKLIVPTVTAAPVSCVVVPLTFAAAPKFAVAPCAFGTPVVFQPGFPLLPQLALAPVQSEAFAGRVAKAHTTAATRRSMEALQTEGGEEGVGP